MKTGAFAVAALVGLAAVAAVDPVVAGKPNEAAAQVKPNAKTQLSGGKGEGKEFFPWTSGWGGYPWGLGWRNPWWGW